MNETYLGSSPGLAEPDTAGSPRVRSKRPRGIEPLASCMASRRSNQLSYGRVVTRVHLISPRARSSFRTTMRQTLDKRSSYEVDL